LKLLYFLKTQPRDHSETHGGGARIKGAEERKKKIVEAMTYVRNNLDWIENIPKVKGYGSGPVRR
jgi:hypothetical protein